MKHVASQGEGKFLPEDTKGKNKEGERKRAPAFDKYTGNLNVRGIHRLRSTLGHLAIAETAIMIHRGNVRSIRCVKPEMRLASFTNIFQLSYRSPI